MRSREIQRLLDAVEAEHGPVERYGSAPSEEHGVCFTIAEIPATFSVQTLEGTLPSERYSVQVESTPPGDFVYISEVARYDFLELVIRMTRSVEEWAAL
jgi:hypothetical protein